MVIWLIGLSGSGKSTLGEAITSQLRRLGRSVIFLDGDVIRQVFGNDVDHTIEGRLVNAKRISSLSKFLSDQGVDIVASVLSIFPEWQQWNRDNISNYFDVYIKCDIDLLIKRDSKGLYKKAILGEIKNVVGIDLLFPEPSLTKLRIENNISYDEFISYADQIIQLAMET